MAQLVSAPEIPAPKGTLAIRDSGLYSARNSSKGALITEASRVFTAIQSGLSVQETHARALAGILLAQRSRETRRRIWDLLHYRYFAPQVGWVIRELAQACAHGPQSQEFVSLLYLHYALRDRLTFDFVTQVLWKRQRQAQQIVSRDDVLDLLDQAAPDQPHIARWTESSRIKLAGSILTALRDFGLLQGKQKKFLVRLPLPLPTAEHLLRLLTEEGIVGRDVLQDTTWRLFLLDEHGVAGILAKLAQNQRVRFEKTGKTVVLQTPDEWRNGHE